MAIRMTFMLCGIGAVLGLVFGWEALKAHFIREFFAKQGTPVQTIATTRASTQDWQPQLEAVGSLRAVNGTDLSLEVGGIVETIHFQSGDDVAAGTLLLSLRADSDVAQLHALEAMADLANINYQRDLKQFKVQAVAQATIDSDAAALKNAQAQVAQQKANIDKKLVRAPFAGHLGIRAVDLGQYVNPGTTIVTLQALDPIYADFFLPQQAIDQVKVGQSVQVRVDTFPQERFTGTVSAINPEVDPTTRNVQIRATLTNPDHRLLPGMYATIDIATGAPQHLVTLPQTAVTYNPYGNTVYVIEDKGKNDKGDPQLVARQTFVTTGATRGDQIAIVNGVKEGEVIVTAGQIKLRNGTPVQIDNSVQPTAEANPELPPNQ